MQGRQHADRRMQRGVAVDDRGGGAERAADRRAGQVHQPAHRLAQRVKGRAVAIGAVLAKTRHRAQNDIGLYFAQPVIAKAHLVHDAGAEILQHDVGGLDQLREHLLAAGVAQVEAEALLAAVVDREIDALPAHQRRRLAGFLAAQFLDLDDFGAEVGEDHAAARPGLVARQLQDPDPVESSAHHRLRAVAPRQAGVAVELTPASA